MMTINDLMKRYKLTAQGMRHFVRKNLQRINADGVHARNTENGWYFDSEAIRIIDEIRNINKMAIIEEIETEKIKAMQKEIDKMQKLLLLTQAKLVESQEKVQSIQNALLESKEKLIESERKLIAAESSKSDLKAELKLEQKMRIESENNEQVLKDELSRIRNRGFWDRVFNK